MAAKCQGRDKFGYSCAWNNGECLRTRNNGECLRTRNDFIELGKLLSRALWGGGSIFLGPSWFNWGRG
jgi:hypothetical protein